MPTGKQDGNERVREKNLRDRQYVELKLAVDYLQVANRVLFRIMEDQGVPAHQFGVLFPIEAIRMLGGNTLQEAEEIIEKRGPYLQALLQVRMTDEYLTMLRSLLLQDYESRQAQKEHPKDALIHGVT